MHQGKPAALLVEVSIHVDCVGPFQSKMLLLVIDAHSKWSEIFTMKSSTVEDTIVIV